MAVDVSISNPGRGTPILPILSVNFVGTLGFSIVVPFMVFLVAKWGGNAIVYGALAATYSAFQLIGAPILGKWSDQVGRRKVLLLSQLGTMLSWFIFLLAFFLPTGALMSVDNALLGQFTLTLPLIVLFVARAADGLTGGNVSVANAYLADITDEEHRTENFGRMAMSTNAGFILGPALAGLLGATVYAEMLPVIAALLISIVASVLIVYGLSESRAEILKNKPGLANACKVFGQETKEVYRLKGCTETARTDILKLPFMPQLMSVNFLVMLGFSFFYIAFPVHAATRLDWSVTDTGIFFAVLSLWMMLVQGPLLARLSGKISQRALVTGGGLLLGLGFVFLLSNSTWSIYAAAFFIALGNGVMWPTFTAVLSKFAGEQMQGAVQGLASSLGAAASIVGLICGGLLYTWAGPWVFLLSAVIIGAAAFVASSLRQVEPVVSGSGN
ncbi:MFS transporter [uncultured Roseibium sp.]|uniref:MFS transporter n=1 Tax=uncultured Roseibium sp. TaxID=1936171 RepID=UPI0026398D1B|nr:MFS transporter [uncultured Roseibium sp.]